MAGVLLAAGALTGCGPDEASYGEPFALPVGATEWAQVPAPAWVERGTLHVGEESVALGAGVDLFVLGRTGAYWMRDQTLMFTDVEGETREVEDVGWSNLAVSADRSVLATVDQSRGPTDRFGTHVMQVAAFDTTTGEQLYRTPDQEPEDGDDLADLYSETMPLLSGVSEDLLFFDDVTIDLSDGSQTPATLDEERVEVYVGESETLFPDGHHVGIRGQGRTREPAPSTAFGAGRLSPDRSLLFDVTTWPARAVAYDARTGERRPVDAPWGHFTLGGFSDRTTFWGAAEQVGPRGGLRARQVVTCALETLACTPLSEVIAFEPPKADGTPRFLLEGATGYS